MSIPYILTLDGITINNIKHSLFDSININELSYDSSTEEETFEDIYNFKVPTYYTKSSWPLYLNIRCMHCGSMCKNMAWPIPISLKKRFVPLKNILATNDCETTLEGNQKTPETYIEICGVACHPCCAQSFIRGKMHRCIVNDWYCSKLLLIIVEELLDINLRRDFIIPCADEPWKIKFYCGDRGISESEYYKSNQLKFNVRRRFV